MEPTPPISQPKIPAGIMNPGNFCYINSAVQCLRHIRPVIDFINGSEKMDEYMFDIVKTFGLVQYQGRPEMEQQLDRIITGLQQHNHLAENATLHKLATEIIERQNSNPSECMWYLTKLRKESTKLFLYVCFRDFLLSLQSDNRTVIPNKFISMCNLVFKDFGMEHLCNGEQNDAQEFVIVLLDYLHDSHSQSRNMNIPSEILDMPESEVVQLEPELRVKYSLLREINQRYSREFTTLNPDIYFYSIDIITCSECRYQNIHFNPMNVLCLPLNNDTQSRKTMYEYMDQYFSTETLDSDYACDKCKNKNRNTISRHIITHPNTLIISLKRFAYDARTQGMKKVTDVVDYPLELDITRYCMGVGPAKYQLVGCINHTGRINFGHYYAFIKRDNKWYLANDDHVTELDQSRILNNPDAYMLFYELAN
jgi:ubiquitin C-terminal hydrolase